MSLSALAVLRHGEEDPKQPCLSRLGQQQVLSTAGQLAACSFSRSVLVLFSTRGRCIHSAGIVQALLNAPARAAEILVWDDQKFRPDEDIDQVVELVQSHAESFDLIVLVTHDPLMFSMPVVVPRLIWGEKLQVDHPCQDSQHGEIILMPWNKPPTQVFRKLSPILTF